MWVFSSWITSSTSLGTRYYSIASFGLDITTSGNSISKPLWIKSTCGVVHVLYLFEFLPWIQWGVIVFVLAWALPSTLISCKPIIFNAFFFIYNCHLVEIIMCETHVFPYFTFHFFFCYLILLWELFYFEAIIFVWIVFIDVVFRARTWILCLSLLLIEVWKLYFRMTTVGRYLGSYLILRVHVVRIYVLWVVLYTKCFLTLPGGYSSGSLNISFLTSTCPPTSNPLLVWIIPTNWHMSGLIEIITCPW